MADAPDLGSGGETRGGSSPFARTIRARNIYITNQMKEGFIIMNIEELLNEKCQQKFKIIVPAGDINNRVELALSEYKDKIQLPGFRPGKVPTSLIKNRFGKEMRQEAVEMAVQDGIRSALNDRNLKPALQPKVTSLNTEIYNDTNIDLVFEVEVETMPNIELVDEAKISLTRYYEEVSDNDVQEFMQKLGEQYPKNQAITENRGAAMGDVAVIDFEGFLNGTAFPGGMGEKHPLELGSNQFIPGFEEQIVGHKVGESFTIKVKFPEQYNSPDLAGKDTEFKITLHEIQEKVKQEVNDEFAKFMGFEDLNMLTGMVRSRMENQNDANARDLQKRQLLDIMDDLYAFDLPPTMVNNDFAQLWQRVEHAKTHNELDEVDKAKNDAELREEYMKIAERRVKLGLVLNEVGRRENIEVTDEEIQGRAMEMARQYPPELRNQYLKLIRENAQFRQEIALPLFEEKVSGYLIDMTTRDEVALSRDDFKKKADEIVAKSERKMSGGDYHSEHDHNHDDHDGHDHSGHDHDHSGHDHSHDHDHSGHDHAEEEAKPAKKPRAKKAKE